MKSWARTFLLILLFPLFTSGDQQKISEPVSKTYIPWTVEQEGYFGSFWWKVNQHRVDTIYYYTVYVYSNSYFNISDGYGGYKKAITKISDCLVWAQDFDEEADFDVGSVVFDWENTYLFEFYTTDSKPRVKIKYSDVSPYDYSKTK